MNTVKHMNVVCRVEKQEYRNGGVALQLYEVATGEPWATATCWIRGLEEGEVAVKNYSENEGMLTALVNGGIVAEPHMYVASGWVHIPVCKLLI